MTQRAPALLLLALLTGCTTLFGKGTPTSAWQNLAEERLVDLSINFRQVGERDYVLFRIPDRSYFLEGYIQGMITDYQDNPIAGVVATASLDTEELVNKLLGKRTGGATATFDPGLTNTQGIYRIRFSLPIRGGLVDAKGRLIYNPQWEQERSHLGKAYEPQRRESSFRIYYDQGSGLVTFTEGLQRIIVSPVFAAPAKSALPGVKAPGNPPPPAGRNENNPEDLLQGIKFP